jgi:xanthine dehydrogenase small subunit
MKPVSPPVATQTLRFVQRDRMVSLDNVPPSRTLLALLREDLGLTGTKEGCGEGDCGACTVVVAEPSDQGLRYRAINSCIRLAHSIDGMALWTVEDLSPTHGPLHPVQQALLQHHGSQCGFCTPGFVMSLFGMYQNRVLPGETITRAQAQADLSGNLCRCTGYRPILDAAQTMGQHPQVRVNEAQVLQALQQLPPRNDAADVPYLSPTSWTAALQARARHPQAQVVAGSTDVGLWVTKRHQRFERVLDLSRVAEWRRIEHHPDHLAIGATATLTDAFAALVQERPTLATLAQRFAGLPVRNAGTLGGNVVNGSPIGDSMPLLLALRASVVLMRWTGTPEPGHVEQRELALEDFYTDYRRNVLAPDELLAWIKVPRPTPPYLPGSADSRGTWLRAYKVSKRWDDDISAVCLVLNLALEQGQVTQATLGVGGVAATTVRARQTEAALTGQPWTPSTVERAGQVLAQEFQPISDMRASAHYRSAVLGRLLQRCWLESQGHIDVSLESLVP